MGKLLIGCYPFSSSGNYGAKHTSVIGWVRGAVKELDDLRQAKSADLEKGNAFQAIFVSPEYQFTDPTAPSVRQAMDEATKNTLLSALEGISTSYKEILMFPGTVFWKQLLDTPENVQKFEAQLVASELTLKNLGRKADVVDANQNLGGKNVPGLKDLSKAVKVTTAYRAYNELYPFLDGKRWTPYLKNWDFKETEGATATSQAFVPGCSAGKKDIGGFEFGMEICFDHFNAGLKGKGGEVDFHIVTSDSVGTLEANMMMKNGGYFIHASSDTNQTCVYSRTGGTKTKLTPTPAIQANQLSWWLVNIAKRDTSQVAINTTPKTPILTTPSGKRLPPGAFKMPGM